MDRISATADDREVLQAAELVREAQLLVFKGLRHEAMESGDNKKLDLKRLAKIDAEMAEWKGKSVEEIVGMYRWRKPQERKAERKS